MEPNPYQSPQHVDEPEFDWVLAKPIRWAAIFAMSAYFAFSTWALWVSYIEFNRGLGYTVAGQIIIVAFWIGMTAAIAFEKEP